MLGIQSFPNNGKCYLIIPKTFRYISVTRFYLACYILANSKNSREDFSTGSKIEMSALWLDVDADWQLASRKVMNQLKVLYGKWSCALKLFYGRKDLCLKSTKSVLSEHKLSNNAEKKNAKCHICWGKTFSWTHIVSLDLSRCVHIVSEMPNNRSGKVKTSHIFLKELSLKKKNNEKTNKKLSLNTEENETLYHFVL